MPGSAAPGGTPGPAAADAPSSGSEEGVNVAGRVEPQLPANGGSGDEMPGTSSAAPAADAGASPPVSGRAARFCPAGPFPQTPLPAGATPRAICTGLSFSEGVVWFDNLATLFLSDFAIRDAASNFDGRILSYQPGGQCQEFIPNTGTNGLAFGLDGSLLGARHLDQTLTRFDLQTKQATVLVADFNGSKFNAPNDIAVRSDGNLYFTDADYMLGNRTSELPTQAYRRDPSGALSVIDPGPNPNGISLSPDEKHLYLSHLGALNDVIVFDVDASGAIGNPQPFINAGSDGMAIDCAGNLYITQAQVGVRVYDPSGNALGTLAAQGAANVAFGGPERRTLFIAAQTRLYAVDLQIPGLPY
jgi:gluconolactonase